MNGQPEVAARVLVERANASGGRDNITVVVIDVLAGGGVMPGDDTTGGAAALLEDTLPVR
jgi:protein phosphatase